jgi:hypothetical protein
MDSTLEKLVVIETKLDMISKILGLEKESIIEKTKRYFELFSTKNVKGLENEMYSDDIHLRDWNGEWKGKQAVLEMNESLFQSEFSIDIESIKKMDNSTIVQFKLHIADTEYRVIDLIDWDDNGKIKRILAYNG